MEITAPYGYGAIVPLQKAHRVLMPAGSTPAFCRRINAIAVSVSEFGAALHDYPLVFVSVGDGTGYAPVAVLGLQNGENLFVDAAGRWQPEAYVPAFVRRYPFCVSKGYTDGKPTGERIVCVATDYLDPAGMPLFTAYGRPTPKWEAIERLIGEYEQDLDRTAAFSAALARLGLLEPFTLQAQRDGASLQLAGMFRVSEEKLGALRAASHKALVGKGYMSRLYAHLHSLDNFARLVERRARAGGFSPQRLTDDRG